MSRTAGKGGKPLKGGLDFSRTPYPDGRLSARGLIEKVIGRKNAASITVSNLAPRILNGEYGEKAASDFRKGRVLDLTAREAEGQTCGLSLWPVLAGPFDESSGLDRWRLGATLALTAEKDGLRESDSMFVPPGPGFSAG